MSKSHPHGPENAPHELRKAYNLLIETAMTARDHEAEPGGVRFAEIESMYRKAFDEHRAGHQRAAERWARTVKHLARAYWHEAKVAFLRPRPDSFPYLPGAEPDDLNLHERIDETADLLEALAEDRPPGHDEYPAEMGRYLARGREHLRILREENPSDELRRAEHIKAAHEYARVLECLGLALEAERPDARAAPDKKPAA